MQKDSGHTIDTLEVDGGLSASDLCMQVKTKYLHIHIHIHPEYNFLPP